ncbi:hypothetical protein [Ferrimonas marina]|uniref:Uncharacterized protein n=1 Tax=Ferrimonas marina TaxID=299255 RepID=A0A1M5YGH2_9GAMM|nr:hypothetical protein [Ferrimonas marina]SHI11171.1 hypothetical protein SAMN02745129_4224 [Ferrimonas marina]
MTLRNTLSQRWSAARTGEQLAKQLRQDPMVPGLFQGATSLVQFAEILATLVHTSEPALLEEPLDELQMMRILACGFQGAVLKGLQGETLNQAEMLLISLSQHYATKPLGESVAPLQQQVLMLFDKWSEVQRAQRASQRNMGG